MTWKVAIFGTGPHGRAIRENLRAEEHKRLCVWLDDKVPRGTQIGTEVVIGGRELLYGDFVREHEIIVGIGDNKIRGEIARTIKQYGGRLGSSFHPTAIVSKTDTVIGQGTVIMPFAIIGPGVRIGEYCIINNRATVAHDSIVENGVNVSDGVTFTTHVGEEAWLGLHACVIPHVKIGARAIVGAGSVVTREVEADTTVVGVPARVIKNYGTHGPKNYLGSIRLQNIIR